MAAAAGSCLSDLSDDLLRRILFFAPTREAASTSVLSRRWRYLWRASSAVNLDSRSFSRAAAPAPEPPAIHQISDYSRRFSDQERAEFLRCADESFAAAAVPVTRLTIFVANDSRINLTHLRDWTEHDLVGAVVSNPAARRVEEIHVEVKEPNQEFSLSFSSLPSESLRLLRVNNCSSLTAAPPPTAAAFPRLGELRLKNSSIPLSDLQCIIDAAPQLATLHLKSCYIETGEEDVFFHGPPAAQRYRLICPAVTALLLEDCTFQSDNVSLELDLPRVQYFMHKGPVQRSNQLSLKPQTTPPNVIHLVDLQLNVDSCGGGKLRAPFWQIIQKFSRAKVLKIKLDFSLDHMGNDSVKSEYELQCTPSGVPSALFCNLERLELDAQYSSRSTASMVILASLLHSCPVVRDLRLKLRNDAMSTVRRSIDQELRVDFDKSVDRFRRRKSSACWLGGQDGDIYEASDIPVLSEQSFSCLQSYLKRVSLHFCMDKPNCLGAQLAKFFAENGVVLEEMFIDDGSQKMCEHINAGVSEMDF